MFLLESRLSRFFEYLRRVYFSGTYISYDFEFNVLGIRVSWAGFGLLFLNRGKVIAVNILPGNLFRDIDGQIYGRIFA